MIARRKQLTYHVTPWLKVLGELRNSPAFLYSQKELLTSQTILVFFRSGRPEVFCKKGVLRNFAKFTGKQPCQSLFFNNVSG